MKYFVILTASIVFFTGSILMVYFLWNLEQEWTWKVLMIICPTFCGYLIIKNLQNYSKIQQNKNHLQVSKLFSSRTYNLNDLTSWTEETNLYRVRYRKMKLTFPNTQLTLVDHVDRSNIEQLYHFLRTHDKSRMKKI